MQSRRGTHKVCDLIPIRRLVEVVPEPFAAAQQHRRFGGVLGDAGLWPRADAAQRQNGTGGHAVLRGRVVQEGGQEKQIERASRFVHVWVRSDGVWQTVYAQSSPATSG